MTMDTIRIQVSIEKLPTLRLVAKYYTLGYNQSGGGGSSSSYPYSEDQYAQQDPQVAYYHSRDTAQHYLQGSGRPSASDEAYGTGFDPHVT